MESLSILIWIHGYQWQMILIFARDSNLYEGKKVSSLFSITENSWDAEVIEDIFDQRDANIILFIPLDRGVNDSWYWRKEKLGNYSVKSAYLLMQEGNHDSNTVASSGFWRKLWNLKISPKVKQFLWRACSQCLPTKDQLLMKRVPINAMCAMCNGHQEIVLHVLVQCAYAA